MSDAVRNKRRALLSWYDFIPGSKALFVGSGDDAIIDGMSKKNVNTVCTDIGDIDDGYCIERENSFQYIICIEALEMSAEPSLLLNRLWRMLSDDGSLILGMNNRLGIRYFCGDTEPHTQKSFEGISNYRSEFYHGGEFTNGRCYSRKEIADMLINAGISKLRFYSVLPDLIQPQLIFAENVMPKEDLGTRYFPAYFRPENVFLEEEFLYDDLCENGLFHVMANSYIVECVKKGELSSVDKVTITAERGDERSLLTIEKEGSQVEKRPLHESGINWLSTLDDHMEDLKKHGVKTIDGRVHNGAYIMPYVDAEIAEVYLRRIAREDKNKFILEVDRFRDIIMHSSEIEKETPYGPVLKRGYLDMVPINCFHSDNDYVFFDQEMCFEHCYADLIVFRMVFILYFYENALATILPETFFYDRYGLTANLQMWRKMEKEYLDSFRNYKEEDVYYTTVRVDKKYIGKKRRFMNNLSEIEFIENTFFNLADKNLYVFGTGIYAEAFMNRFSGLHKVEAALDNNKEKQGGVFMDIPICSPDLLLKLDPDSYRVVICVKGHEPILKQLLEMGVRYYSVYDVFYRKCEIKEEQ